MVLITIVMGVYKPTYNWVAPHCMNIYENPKTIQFPAIFPFNHSIRVLPSSWMVSLFVAFSHMNPLRTIFPHRPSSGSKGTNSAIISQRNQLWIPFIIDLSCLNGIIYHGIYIMRNHTMGFMGSFPMFASYPTWLWLTVRHGIDGP